MLPAQQKSTKQDAHLIAIPHDDSFDAYLNAVHERNLDNWLQNAMRLSGIGVYSNNATNLRSVA